MNLPKNTGWIPYYIKDGKKHLLHEGMRRTKAAALRYADIYMYEHQIQTGILECCY